jgi:hypothetical protein
MLQFPAPLPQGHIPSAPSPVEQFIACLPLSANADTFIFLTLPRPLFCKLFWIAFPPFLRERLDDTNDKDHS